MGIGFELVRPGPGMVQGALPRPYSSVRSGEPGARTLVPSVTWKPLFLVSFPLVHVASWSLGIGVGGCGLG